MQAATRVSTIPILADLLLRADGSYQLKPIVEANWRGADTWIKPKEAARILHVSKSDVHRWLGVYLVFRRATPHRIELSLESVMELQRACNDPEFWMNRELQEGFKERVAGLMKGLLSSSNLRRS